MQTPAFVIYKKRLREGIKRVASVCSNANALLLYSLKPLGHHAVLREFARHCDGFSVCSLSQARTAKDVSGDAKISVVSPAYLPSELEEICSLGDYVICNSLGQFDEAMRFRAKSLNLGLRVNPQLSFLKDRRYDPCAPHSRLGIPLSDLIAMRGDRRLANVSGLHFHTNCDSTDCGELLATIKKVSNSLDFLLRHVSWINIGGGYLLDDHTDTTPLVEGINLLREFKLQVILEPGATLVREAGAIVSTVLDVVQSDGKEIVILDTTVNHMPEVFEYQFEPDVATTVANGRYWYILAGRSCLAGDIFGEYAFNVPIRIGAKIAFENAGAYTLPKWNTFNGIPKPSVYLLSDDGSLTLQ